MKLRAGATSRPLASGRHAQWSDCGVRTASELERDSFRERSNEQVDVSLHDGFVRDSFPEGQLDGQQHGLWK
jgi:hypothetical protein